MATFPITTDLHLFNRRVEDIPDEEGWDPKAGLEPIDYPYFGDCYFLFYDRKKKNGLFVQPLLDMPVTYLKDI